MLPSTDKASRFKCITIYLLSCGHETTHLFVGMPMTGQKAYVGLRSIVLNSARIVKDFAVVLGFHKAGNSNSRSRGKYWVFKY